MKFPMIALYLTCLLGFTIAFSPSAFARGSTLELNILSVTQDLMGAKSRQALAFAQISVSENELQRRLELHEQLKEARVKQPNSVSDFEFKESELAIVVLSSNIKEIKELHAAATADVAVYENYLKELNGVRVKPDELKNNYLALWTSKKNAALLGVERAEAELAFAVYSRDLTATLFEKKAESGKTLIEKQHNLARAEVVLQRAKEFVQVCEEAIQRFKSN